MEDLRYELKATCPAVQRASIIMRLKACGLRDLYPVRTVNSLYWDTPNSEALAANLSGLADRDKLRLRWYGDSGIHEPVIELKYKRGMVGGKEQFELNRDINPTDSYDAIYYQLLEKVPAGSWRARLHKYSRPVLIERYTRSYYGLPNSELRVTIDEDLASYPQQASRHPNLLRHNPQSPAIVVELKAPSEALPLLVRLADSLGLNYAKHSKFVQGLVGEYTGGMPTA